MVRALGLPARDEHPPADDRLRAQRLAGRAAGLNLEWFVDYDPEQTEQTPVDRDAILTNVTIFWLTRTAGSAARLYFETGAELLAGRPSPSGAATAVANFPGDNAIQDLARLSNVVTRWREHDQGGHFPALQAPEVLIADVREFFRSLPGTP
ncbi:hypothetical protein [Saccharopolyspora gregorii]|uniref:hypothetical protein n=1 Tax=Saccharopolyspora gregorii TaxID=33914 RepID=UPI0031ED60B3